MSITDACKAAKISHAKQKRAAPWDEGYEAAILNAAADFASADETVPEHVRQTVAQYLRSAVAANAGEVG